MKKSKRSFPWEEPSEDSSDDTLDAAIDDADEEIIDLEEIVEPDPEAAPEDDELAFDVEILDEETGIGFRDFHSSTESEEDYLIDDDLLKELPFFQDMKAEPEPVPKTPVAKEKPEELSLDLLLAGTEGAPDEAVAEGMVSAPEEVRSEASAPSPVPETLEAASDVGGDGGEPVPPEDTGAEDQGEPATPAPAAEMADAGVSLDALVGQMENRLAEALREIVESRLPEIVRTVLREEIERLKNEQEPQA